VRGGVRRAQKFRRSDDGAAAVEFAIVALPFLATMLAIIEVAFVFFASQVLETATADAARRIMTGEVQKAGGNEASFKADVCGRLLALFDCTNGIKIDVKKFSPSGADANSPFGSLNLNLPIDEDGELDTDGFAFDAGVQGDIVLVRVIYEWPTFVRGLGMDLATLANGNRLLMATAAFRNEPYSKAPAPPPPAPGG